MKSFQPKDGSGERDFHGEKRSNKTHASTTDPDARLYKKAEGQASKLCRMGHVAMENRSGLMRVCTAGFAARSDLGAVQP